MFRPPLTGAEFRAYEDAVRSSERTVRFWARLYNKEGVALPTPLSITGGEVIFDTTSRANSPTRTAHVTLIDASGDLDPRRRHGVDGAGWFAKGMGIWVGIWVPALSEWVDIPVFRGRVSEVTRRGAELEIDLRGLEAGHIPPHSFPKPFSVKKHARIGHAIKNMLKARGETKFDFPRKTRRMPRARTWGIGRSPWSAALKMTNLLVKDDAKAAEYQLFVQGNGTFKIRRKKQHVVWSFRQNQVSLLLDEPDLRMNIDGASNVFIVIAHKVFRKAKRKTTKLSSASAVGATSFTVTSSLDFIVGRKVVIGRNEQAETRVIKAVSGSTITVKSGTGSGSGNALYIKHPKGAQVQLWYSDKVRKTSVGRDWLKASHPLSSWSLSGNKRPLVWVQKKEMKEERPGQYEHFSKDVRAFHKKVEAQARAKRRNAAKNTGVAREFSFSCVPVYHLEEGDIVAVEVNGSMIKHRLRQWTIPLSVDGTMEVGWGSEDVPKRRPRKKKAGRRGRN